MVPPSPEHGALDRARCLWVLTALAATGAAGWAVWFASGHPSAASPTATAIRAASSPTLRPVCSLDFRDTKVGETDWSVATTSPTTLTIAWFTEESADLGGPDDNSYRTTHLGFAGAGQLSVLHLRRDAVYDPGACGRAATIDASYWLQNPGEPRPAQVVSFAVRQGGTVYTAGRRVVDSSFWTKVDLTGLREADFDLVAGIGPAHPDFSAGQLEFGYLTANSCGLGVGAPPCLEYQTVAAIAVWQVVVHR